MDLPRLLPRLTWLLGFCLAANVYLLPGRPQSPRALDVLGIGLGLWLILRLLSGGARTLPLLVLLLLDLIPLCWTLYAWQEGMRTTMLMGVRWLLAVPVAYAFFLAAGREELRIAASRGLWWGLAVNVGVLALQQAGLEPLTYRLGLAAPDSDFITIDRFFLRSPGMHGHANASAAVASLVVPVGLYLYYRGRARLWLPLVSLLLLAVAGHVTSSRSPLLVAGLSFVLAALTSRRFLRTAVLMAAVAIVAVPLWIRFGPPGGRVRWEDTAHMAANTQERLDSNRAALDLAAGHILGLGIERSQAAMQEQVETSASHNAFLQVALVFGPLQAAAVLILLGLLAFRAPWGVWPPWGLEALLALQLCGLYLFEEHLNNPTFIVLTGWLVLASVARLGEAPAPGAVPAGRAAAPPIGG